MSAAIDTGHGALDRLLGAVLEAWPKHQGFVEKALADRAPEVLALSAQLADGIIRLVEKEAGGLAGACRDYRHMCEDILAPEELHFHRHGRYRLSRAEDAVREVYANAGLMHAYMNGLLLSQVLWANHANSFAHYVRHHLAVLPDGARHLEVGPGHGLFLYFAARSGRVASVSGWDLSPTSIEKTRHALNVLGITVPVSLQVQDLFVADAAAQAQGFDSIVLSEILEHLEQPLDALRAVRRWLNPGGRLWINVPANSPAPDHLYLFTSFEDAVQMAREAGFEIEDSAAFPMTGMTLEKAIRRKLSVSCVLSCRVTA